MSAIKVTGLISEENDYPCSFLTKNESRPHPQERIPGSGSQVDKNTSLWSWVRCLLSGGGRDQTHSYAFQFLLASPSWLMAFFVDSPMDVANLSHALCKKHRHLSLGFGFYSEGQGPII